MKLAWLLPAVLAAAAPRNSPVHEAVDELAVQLVARLPPPQGDRRTRVAVIEFESLGANAQQARLGRVLSDLLSARLTREPKLELVERERLSVALANQRAALVGPIDPHSAQAVGRLLAADFIVAGSVSELGENYDVTVRLLDAERARVAGAASAQIPKSAVASGGRANAADLAHKGLDVLEIALQAWGAQHTEGFMVHWPSRLEDLVPSYLDRLPDASGGRWLYDAKEGRASHSEFPQLKPTHPRLAVQGVLDDSKREFLKEQAQQIRLALANFCAENSGAPPTLEAAMPLPVIPARYAGHHFTLPPEALHWGYNPETGEAWNLAAPEIKARVNCGGPSPLTPAAKTGALRWPAAAEKFLNGESFAGLELAPAPARLKRHHVSSRASAAGAKWLATDKGLLIEDGSTRRLRRIELRLEPWSAPLESCSASGNIVWCLDSSGRLLQIDAGAYPKLSARTTTAPVTSPASASPRVGPEGLWVILSSSTLGLLPAPLPGDGATLRLIVFNASEELRRVSGTESELVVHTASKRLVFDLGAIRGKAARRSAGGWVFKSFETRPGQRVEEGIALTSR